jgi:hypothetical protein
MRRLCLVACLGAHTIACDPSVQVLPVANETGVLQDTAGCEGMPPEHCNDTDRPITGADCEDGVDCLCDTLVSEDEIVLCEDFQASGLYENVSDGPAAAGFSATTDFDGVGTPQCTIRRQIGPWGPGAVFERVLRAWKPRI